MGTQGMGVGWVEAMRAGRPPHLRSPGSLGECRVPRGSVRRASGVRFRGPSGGHGTLRSRLALVRGGSPAHTERVGPRYLAVHCILTADGVRVLDTQGGVGGGLTSLAGAYGGRAAASRLEPCLRKFGELAERRRILFVHDPFSDRQPFPDDFFNLVETYAAYGPITDWVPDLQSARTPVGGARRPGLEEMGAFLDPLARRLRLRLAYCSTARVDYQHGEPKLLLSGFRERARQDGTSAILSPEDVGVLVFTGAAARFPDDLRNQDWFPVVNPPVFDELLEHKWLVPALLQGTRGASFLPRRIPVGMGLRSRAEIQAFATDLQAPGGFPLAVLEPSLQSLLPGLRYLDRTALRALASHQPESRVRPELAESLLAPSVSHAYEEIGSYRGKQLDNLLRTRHAKVHDHGDGTFHFSAEYPFLECTVSLLREFVEARPVRSRRTGKLHRGTVRVVLFERKIVAAVHHLGLEPDDGTFRDLNRPDVPSFHEAASPEDEATLQEALGLFAGELEREFDRRRKEPDPIRALLSDWLRAQATNGGAEPL